MTEPLKPSAPTPNGNGKPAPEADESPFHGITHHKKHGYLLAIIETGGNVTRACEMAGISRYTPYSRPWVEDLEFQSALAAAKALAIEQLEAEALRRAYEGVDEQAGWYKGAPGGTVRRYSDTLLIFLLKGAMPDKYRETVEIRGKMLNLNFDLLPQEAVSRIAAGEDVYAVLASLAAGPLRALAAGADADG